MLVEWVEQLRKDPIKFRHVFDISCERYEKLNSSFMKDKWPLHSITQAEAFPAILLVNRFNLNTHAIKAIVMPSAATTTAERFRNCALNWDGPNIQLKIKHLDQIEYEDFDDFKQKAFKLISPQPLITKKLRKPDNENWLEGYLSKPVSAKKKTGEANFLQLMNCALVDCESNTQTAEQASLYLAALLHSHQVLSSYVPLPGQGKVQVSSVVQPNKYARTQASHPLNGHYRELMASNSKNETCLLKRNNPLQKILTNSGSAKDKFKRIKLFNDEGYLSDSSGVTDTAYLNNAIAHSGLRLNTYSNLEHAIKKKLQPRTEEEWQERLRDINILTNNRHQQILPVEKKTLQKRLQSIQALCKTLFDCDQFQGEPAQHLGRLLNSERKKSIKRIMEQVDVANLIRLNITSNRNSTCLYVEFYPKDTIPNNANYSEGVTNVIIGLFGGLVNHLCDKKQLTFNIQRRPSFGFNRTTLTDVGSMRMRISIGLEGELLADVLVDALKQFDGILNVFDFTDNNNQQLAKGFAVAENPKGKYVTDNTGIVFRKVMRSDKNMLAAVNVAHHALSCDDSKPIKQRVQKYIDSIVGENFEVAKRPVNYAVTETDVNIVDSNVHAISLLLKNTLLAVRKRVEESFIYSYSIEQFCFSYWFILVKLYKNCKKADFLLSKSISISESHFFSKSLLLIENLAEYLFMLDNIIYQQKMCPDVDMELIEGWRTREIDYMEPIFSKSTGKVSAFFTSGGQQALVSSIFILLQECAQHTGVAKSIADVSLSPSVYYELREFVEHDMSLATSTTSKSKIAVIDIQDLANYMQRDKTLSLSSYFIIDITHRPFANNNTLKAFMQLAAQENKSVILTSSMLKHEEIGLDKYQLGKIICCFAKDKKLSNNCIEELKAIERSAIHPYMASFQTVIDDILCEKNNEPGHNKKSKLQI